jgi:hypothetical protein
MQLFPAKNWIEFFKEAGFKNVNSRNIGAADNWNGTLVVIGEK